MTLIEQFNLDYGIRNDGQTHMAPLNLDGMPVDDLAIAAEHPALHNDVRAYAATLIQSRTLRLDGKIAEAQRLEDKNDIRYEHAIPRCCRW